VASLFAQKLQGFNGNPIYHCHTLEVIQPVPWKMRLEMLNQMVIEILNGGDILVN